MLADTQLWWYVARSSGIVAWALLAASMLWGLALSTKFLGPRPRANWLLDLHRFLGGLAVVFTGVHVGALLLDDYTDFGPTDVLVPFTSSYRPGAVAWGVAALYLLAAVEITSLLRTRIPRRMWRKVHVLSFPLFAASTAHGLLAGTDSTGSFMFGAMALVTVVVGALTLARVDQVRHPERRRGPATRRPPGGPTRPATPTIRPRDERTPSHAH